MRPSRLLLCALAMASALATTPARAQQQHALLMWIGQYGTARNNLPGIDIDARRARQMATAMGVPDRLRVEVSESALTLQGMADALAALERRVMPGDMVFIYFSGHGKQIDGIGVSSRCSEGLVTRDGALYLDAAIDATLRRLAAKARQVVMMNDSCHSGGAATKSFGTAEDDEVPKAYPSAVADARPGVVPSALACGEASNKSGDMSRAFGTTRQEPGWLYLAAARADEVAYASPRGSRATRAWHTCLTASATDADGDGYISGEELRACAQRLMDVDGRPRQNITLQGDSQQRLVRVRAP